MSNIKIISFRFSRPAGLVRLLRVFGICECNKRGESKIGREKRCKNFHINQSVESNCGDSHTQGFRVAFDETPKQIFFMFVFGISNFGFLGQQQTAKTKTFMLIIVHCLKSKINFLHAFFVPRSGSIHSSASP